MKKLYVGNLPYSVTEEGIESLFSQYGEVESVILIKDRDTGRAKGFGFVEFVSQADAEKAIELDGRDFEGRNLKVNMAKPKEAGAGGRGGDRGGRGGRW
ncbi:MAG: RNA-binding protein [Gammaproteobacteria bacterium]|nr:RNA-binding protein [Gammaproteobacteria bacterium]